MAEFKRVFNMVSEKIINAGMQFDEFQEWLSQKKQGGQNLENWTESEMKSMIEAFIKSKQQVEHLGGEELELSDFKPPEAGFDPFPSGGNELDQFDLEDDLSKVSMKTLIRRTK